eukprot:768109-Hanusia_phi.AAC.3
MTPTLRGQEGDSPSSICCASSASSCGVLLDPCDFLCLLGSLGPASHNLEVQLAVAHRKEAKGSDIFCGPDFPISFFQKLETAFPTT